MFKKFITILTILFYTYFLFACTTTSYNRSKGGTVTSPNTAFKAKKFPEILIHTSDRGTYKGKMVTLEGKEIGFLPSPYWNKNSIKIDLNKVHSIELEKKGSSAANGFAGGFAFGFLVIGIVAGLSSEYNVDYENALLGAAVVGLGVGLLGLIIGAIADTGKKSKYELHKLPDPEKIRAIQYIMGL